MEVANTCCSIPALYSQKPTLSHPVRVSIMRSVGGDGFVWYCHLLPLTESTKVRGRGGVSYRNTHQKTQSPKGPCWKRAPEVTQLQCSHPKLLGVVWEAWASAPTCPGNTSHKWHERSQALGPYKHKRCCCLHDATEETALCGSKGREVSWAGTGHCSATSAPLCWQA